MPVDWLTYRPPHRLGFYPTLSDRTPITSTSIRGQSFIPSPRDTMGTGPMKVSSSRRRVDDAWYGNVGSQQPYIHTSPSNNDRGTGSGGTITRASPESRGSVTSTLTSTRIIPSNEPVLGIPKPTGDATDSNPGSGKGTDEETGASVAMCHCQTKKLLLSRWDPEVQRLCNTCGLPYVSFVQRLVPQGLSLTFFA